MDTVRAYGYERRFALESDEHVNYNNRCAGPRSSGASLWGSAMPAGFPLVVKHFSWSMLF